MTANAAQRHPGGLMAGGFEPGDGEAAKSDEGAVGAVAGPWLGSPSGRFRLFARLGRGGAEALVGRAEDWDALDRATGRPRA